MGISTSQQINQILSQMGLDRHGVKRGSVFVPLLAIVLMLLAFLAWVVPMDRAHDRLGQLRHWNSVIYDYAPRKMPVHAVISDTVFERMTNSVPVYAPQSLFNHNEELDEKRDKVTAHVARLKDTESLSGDEQKAVLKFMGRLRLTRWSKYSEDLEVQLEKDQRIATVMPKSSLANPPPEPAAVPA